MKLEDLGYSDRLEAYRTEQNLEGFETGRVIAEHKERYIIKTVNGDFEAEITGHMRFTAKSREDFPHPEGNGFFHGPAPFPQSEAWYHQRQIRRCGSEKTGKRDGRSAAVSERIGESLEYPGEIGKGRSARLIPGIQPVWF